MIQLDRSSTMLCKEAVYKEAFIKALGTSLRRMANVATTAIKEHKIQNMAAIGKSNNTLSGMMLGSLKEHGAFGAETLQKGLNKARGVVADIDTGLGAIARGKVVPGAETARNNMFTFGGASGNTIKKTIDGATHEIWQSRPSISIPVGSFARNVLVPTLAMNKGMEYVEAFNEKRHKTSLEEQAARDTANKVRSAGQGAASALGPK